MATSGIPCAGCTWLLVSGIPGYERMSRCYTQLEHTQLQRHFPRLCGVSVEPINRVFTGRTGRLP